MSQNGNNSLWEEIKRRKVIRVVIAYLIVGWGLIEIADVTSEPLRLPDWSDTLVIWLVALGFPIAIILAWILDVTPRGIEVTPDAQNDVSPSPPDASIAVLPFVNMSGNEENEYFSDGLSEELLNLLVRLKSVRVCSRTSSFALKGKDVDMPTIAAQLGVRHVLEGSVRRSGDKVRITAQLIDAIEDNHLWSETYDRELQDIFAVQDDISSRIFEAMHLQLTAETQQAARATTDDFEALDYYLRGRDQYHRTAPGHIDKAREMFERAIRIDPNYALAWAGLTYVYVDTYWYKDKERNWIERAHESSSKAVELAPHLAEPHSARGLALRADEKFEEAETEFETAIKINPRLFEPLHFYAQMARSLHQWQKAIDLFERAAEVRPEDYQALAVAIPIYEVVGDVEGGIRAARESLDRIERAMELNPVDARACILGAHALIRLGENDKALEWGNKALQINPAVSGIRYNMACLYAQLGRIEEAIDELEIAVDMGARNKRYFTSDQDLERLRGHPRFEALLERI